MLKEIYERLGLTSDLASEKNRFQNRVHVLLDKVGISVGWGSHYIAEIGEELNLKLGVVMPVKDRPLDKVLPGFMINSSFEEILIFCEVLLTVLEEMNLVRPLRVFSDGISTSLKESIVDLGILFKNNKFYRKGAEVLDTSLILQPLDWLSAQPVARQYFEDALSDYLKRDFPDAVTKTYSSLESLVKAHLKNNKTFANNNTALLKSLSLSNDWKGILVHYSQYANEFSSRHGKNSVEKIEPDPVEVEAYLYFTGLVMRLILQRTS
jgi:hypothetical protein